MVWSAPVFITVAFACSLLPAQGTPSAISTNFQGSGGRAVAGPAGIAGTTPFGGWNNVSGGAGSAVVIRDQAGADRGTRLQFTSASSGYRLNPPATSTDGALFDGQIITSAGGGPATVTVTGIPYGRYDVYAYVGHGPAHAGHDVEVQLATTTFAFQNENVQLYVNPVTFRLVTSTTVPGQIGNYVVFAGEAASSFTLTLRPATSGTPGSSGLAGLQIVDRGVDSDNDGLDDSWELLWFGNLAQTATGDPDQDQLSNLGEFQNGTVPVDPDTDDDLSLDGAEIGNGTDPLDADSDDDELIDGVETDTFVYVSPADTGTDPLVPDTDGDGPRDGAEVRRGSDPCDPQSLPDLPNVIVILADDLGWGEVGCFGQTLIQTPNLDQLAQDGMRFTQFYCGSPVCAPTRSTIQEGKHTGRCTVRNNSQSATLAADTFTIGRMLQREGYTTSFIGKWGVGDVGHPGLPNLQGYDHFFGFLDQTHAHWYYPDYLWRNTTQVQYPTNNGVFGPTNDGTAHAQDEMTREALTWIDNNHQRPFFLQLAYCIPHVSLQEPPHSDPVQAALGRTAIEEFYPNVGWAEPNANFASSHYTSNARPRHAYAAMITAMDRDIGLVLQKLVQHGIDDDTLVLFTSDNGTTYCCGVDYQFFSSLAGLRGYKGQVWEGGIRVPTIARWPNRIPSGAVTDHVGAVYDILATMADLIDAETPDDIDGVSFLPTLLGQPGCQEQHDYLYWEYIQGGNQKAVRMGDYKGVRYGDAGSGAALQVFDLANDPFETTNIAAQQPAIAAELDRVMASRHTYNAQWYRGNDEFPVISNVALSNASPDLQLDSSAIGYVQCPLVRDATETVSLPLVAQMQNLSGRGANISLLLGDGPGLTQAIAFELDAQQAVYRIRHGVTVLQAPFGAGVNPYGWFDVTCTYDPATGAASMLDQGALALTGQLPVAPPTVSHYGYRVTDARTRISPLDPALEGHWRASWTPFGAGCLGSAGTPLLRAVPSSRPFVSACFEAELYGLPVAATLAFGAFGFSDTAWGSLPLPLGLLPYGMPGCTLHVAADAVAGLAVSQGHATWPVTIPAFSGLIGLHFFQQALVFDPGANALGATVSNAGEAVIGIR